MTDAPAMLDVQAVADEAFAALSTPRQIAPFSGRSPGLSQQEAYRVTSLLRRAFEARGDKILGRKIGFTNRRIWPEYGVSEPNWGYVTDHTVIDLAATTSIEASCFVEPKIEPEIMFGFATAPSPGMDEAELLACTEWVAFGYEIVQSIYPGWRFKAQDTAAANAMHAALLVGARHPIAPRRHGWLRELARFDVELCRDGKVADRGNSSNVLDGPINVLAHLVGMLARDPFNPPIAAGEIVSTGTLTRALPIHAGEIWTASLNGIPLEPIRLRLE